MSEPPRLPDTDDPFELLGVARGASEIELKRAYVRLIKQFRPERAPEEFQRIHAAYERARAQTRWIDHQPEPDLDPESDIDAGWADPDDGGESEPPWLARYREAAADSDAAAIDVVARAIAEHQRHAADVAIELDDAALARLARRPELAWDNLREQANRWAALELLGARFDQLLLASDPAVVSEIADPIFRRDLLAEPELERLALRVLIRAAWEGDARVEALYAMISDTTSGSDFRLHALFRAARTLGPTLAELAAGGRVPPSLLRFVTNFPQVGAAARKLLLDGVDRDIVRYPRQVLGVIDAMALADVRLVYLLEEIVSDLLWADDGGLGELPEGEREYIDGVLAGADVELRTDERPGLRLAAAAAAAAGATLLLPPAVALLAGFSIFGAVLFWSFLPEPRAYALYARPRFAALAGAYGISPEHIVEWIGRRVRLRNRFSLEVSVSDDLDLHVFARLARLCILWREDDA